MADIRALRRAAEAFLKALRPDGVRSSDGVDVRFNRYGEGKLGGYGERILRAIPAIPGIIKKGAVEGPLPASEKWSARGVVGIYRYTADVKVGADARAYGVLVHEMRDGRRFYYITDGPEIAGSQSRATEGALQPDPSGVTPGALNLFEVGENNNTPLYGAQPDLASLTGRLTTLGLSDKVSAQVVDYMGGKVAGSYHDGIIQIARNSSQSSIDTLNHEAIHAIRDMGLLSATEWSLLKNAVRSDVKLMGSIKARYPSFHIDPSIIRNALMVGGEKYKMVLPEEVAETLNQLRREDVQGMFEMLVQEPLKAWKRWVLLSPRRIIKYNINNMSGDLDAVIAGNPRALRRAAEASKELYAVMRKKEAPSARYNEAIERGVFDSGLSIQEIPDINTLSEFEHLTKANRSLPGKALDVTLGKAWRAMQGFTQFRENIMRYALYLDYADRIEAGEKPSEFGYGASIPAMVDAVVDQKDKAALLARDLIGDYGAVSHGGQALRKYVIPFYSWMEVNTKRYWRLTGNAASQGIGRGIATGGGLAIASGVRQTAWLGLRMAAVYGLIALWNGVAHKDEEDELSADQRQQMHIILGRDSSGQIMTLRLQGAASDAFSWLGLTDVANAYQAYQQGRGGVAGILEAPLKAPINKVAGSLSPVFTVPVETATGKKVFPDVFNMRANRDPWRNLFQTFGLENEYDATADKPSRGYASSWVDATIYRRDPGEIAYDESRGLAYDWLRREKGQEGSSSFTTPRSEEFRNYRQALRFKDEEAAQAALDKMDELGVTGHDLHGMLKRAAPLGPIPKKDRRAFINSLTDEEYAKLQSGDQWYRQTFN